MESLLPNITYESNKVINLNTQENINLYYQHKNEIAQRIKQLEKETDIEKIFRLRDATFITFGIVLSLVTHEETWLIFPLYSAISIFIHGFTGHRIGTSLLQILGFRTRKEIEKEKYALKALRGDFHFQLDVPNAVWEAVNK